MDYHHSSFHSYVKRRKICIQPSYNFEVQFQARKELATAEGFKQDYNFLWRLLGRVHAARGAIQCLMGEEVSCFPNIFQIFAFLAWSVFHLVLVQIFNQLTCFTLKHFWSPNGDSHTPSILKLWKWMYIWCAFFGRQSLLDVLQGHTQHPLKVTW